MWSDSTVSSMEVKCVLDLIRSSLFENCYAQIFDSMNVTKVNY